MASFQLPCDLANLPSTPLCCRNTRINFKNEAKSRKEPIRFTMVRFFPAFVAGVLSSPISKDHLLPFNLAHTLKAEVKVKDLGWVAKITEDSLEEK